MNCGVCGCVDFYKLELSNQVYVTTMKEIDTDNYGNVSRIYSVDLHACKKCGTVKIET